jgi:hypothetical protein
MAEGSRQLEAGSGIGEQFSDENNNIETVRVDNKTGTLEGFVPGFKVGGSVDTFYSRSLTNEEFLGVMTSEEKQQYGEFLELTANLFPSKLPVENQRSSTPFRRRAELVLMSIVTGVSFSAISTFFPSEASAGKSLFTNGSTVSEQVLIPEPSGVNQAEIENIIANDSTIKTLKELGRPTEYYENRLRKIWGYKQELIKDGCQEINLQACAEACYAIDEKGLNLSKNTGDSEKTVLKNYMTKDQVFEFGRTGEIPKDANFQIIYFKDENGNQTNEPALFYVANPEVKGSDIDVNFVQEVLDWWEDVSPGFLRSLIAKIRVLHQGQVGEIEKNLQFGKYYDTVVFLNFSDKSSSSSNEKFLKRIFAVEPFGAYIKALGMGDNSEDGLAKPILALLCCKYIYIGNKNDQISSFIKFFQNEANTYLEAGGFGMTVDEQMALAEDCEKLMVSFGAKSWEEINKALKESN